MKNTILIPLLLFLVTGPNLFAQQYQQEKELIEGILGKAKKDFVAEAIEIPAGSENAFWVAYNAYEVTRQALTENRVNLMSAYVQTFDQDDPKFEKEFMGDVFRLRREVDKNIKRYYSIIRRNVGSKTAMQFVQIEEYLRSAIEYNIYGNLPLKM